MNSLTVSKTVQLSRTKMGEHHKRINKSSKQCIKREALEFMSYESTYAKEKEWLMGRRQAGGRRTEIMHDKESSEHSFPYYVDELEESFLLENWEGLYGEGSLKEIQEVDESELRLSLSNSPSPGRRSHGNFGSSQNSVQGGQTGRSDVILQ